MLRCIICKWWNSSYNKNKYWVGKLPINHFFDMHSHNVNNRLFWEVKFIISFFFENNSSRDKHWFPKQVPKNKYIKLWCFFYHSSIFRKSCLQTDSRKDSKSNEFFVQSSEDEMSVSSVNAKAFWINVKYYVVWWSLIKPVFHPMSHFVYLLKTQSTIQLFFIWKMWLYISPK